MLTVSIVEDEDPYREILCHNISGSRGFRLLSAYATAEEALKRFPVEKPDVALMDGKLPGMDGIECIRRLRQIVPALPTHFIVLTANENDNLIFDALRSGTHGFLLKDKLSKKILLAAIKEAAIGGLPLTPAVARKVLAYFQALPGPTVPLTDKEQDVLRGLAEDLMYKEIAANLSIPINTLRKRVGSIYDKLHVNRRKDAVRFVQDRSSPSGR